MRFKTEAGKPAGGVKRAVWYWESPAYCESGDRKDLVKFILRAPGIDFDRVLNKRLAEPIPPTKGFSKNKDGSFALDGNGAPIPLKNYDDPNYKSERSLYERLVMAGWIWEAIRSDNDFEDVPQEPESENDTAAWKQFYGLVWDAFRESGFTLGDLAKLQREVMKLSGIAESDIDLAKNA